MEGSHGEQCQSHPPLRVQNKGCARCSVQCRQSKTTGEGGSGGVDHDKHKPRQRRLTHSRHHRASRKGHNRRRRTFERHFHRQCSFKLGKPSFGGGGRRARNVRALYRWSVGNEMRAVHSERASERERQSAPSSLPSSFPSLSLPHHDDRIRAARLPAFPSSGRASILVLFEKGGVEGPEKGPK